MSYFLNYLNVKHNRAAVVLAVLVFAVFAGCASSKAAPPAENTGAKTLLDGGRIIFPPKNLEYAESRPNIADNRELTVVTSGDSLIMDYRQSYNAREAQIFTALYEGLFSYHPLTLEPVPAAASSWRISADRKVWTFTIRPGARFSNGDALRAEDFRAAWLSVLEPENECPYSSLFDIIEGARDYRMGVSADPLSVGITALAEKTLEVRLTSPAAYFPSMLCHHSFYPIHPSMIQDGDWTRPVSNGPFVMEDFDRDKIVLAKDARYWDAASVSLNRITIRVTNSDEEAAALWNSGEARWIEGGVDLDALTDRSGIQVNPMFATYYFFIRTTGPWEDYRLRRALSLALPWPEIRQGHYLPAKNLVYPINGYPSVDGIENQDIEEAKRLFAEAGHPSGVNLDEIIIRVVQGEEEDRIAKLMAAAWMELGLAVKIDVISPLKYFDSMKDKNYNVGSLSWIGDFADPYTFLQMWRRDSNINDAWFNDADFEALMEQSMNEEGRTRFETLAKAEQLLIDRGAVLPVSHSIALNVVDTDELDGWFANPLDIHPYKYFSFKSLKPLPGVAYILRPFAAPVESPANR
ncbi:MAG: peptide ABC transporter substrate-binding protein [Treponema sp.]|jgi:peptide/nickel transport system substrate-binding protein/oligopeptide transport system substrate-binding protein|nr:peptide ABC transporter substrate-binding protein [Treponema sp.]